MASNQTEHYQLPLWQPQDDFLRTEFNESHQLLDTALYRQAETLAALRTHVPLLDTTTSGQTSQLSVELDGIDLSEWHELHIRLWLPSHSGDHILRVNSNSGSIYYNTPLGSSYNQQSASDSAGSITWSATDFLEVAVALPLYMTELPVMVRYEFLSLPTGHRWHSHGFSRVTGVAWSQLETVDLVGTIPSGSHVQVWGVK